MFNSGFTQFYVIFKSRTNHHFPFSIKKILHYFRTKRFNLPLSRTFNGQTFIFPKQPWDPIKQLFSQHLLDKHRRQSVACLDLTQGWQFHFWRAEIGYLLLLYITTTRHNFFSRHTTLYQFYFKHYTLWKIS